MNRLQEGVGVSLKVVYSIYIVQYFLNWENVLVFDSKAVLSHTSSGSRYIVNFTDNVQEVKNSLNRFLIRL